MTYSLLVISGIDPVPHAGDIICGQVELQPAVTLVAPPCPLQRLTGIKPRTLTHQSKQPPRLYYVHPDLGCLRAEAEMLGPRSSNLASLFSRHAKTPSGPPFRRACLNKSLGCYGSTLVLPSSAGTLFRVPRRCQRKSWQPYSLSLRPIGCLAMLHRTMDGVMISDGYR